MRGNICRCGTYQDIRQAIHRAAEIKARRQGMSTATVKVNRRGFLQVGASAAAGLLRRLLSARELKARRADVRAAADAKLNAWIHIAPDDTVTFMIHKAEMGQGTVTSLSQLLAEELECDWGKFRTEFPPVDPAFGLSRAWSAARAFALRGTPLRHAGATAREMLVQAAAQTLERRQIAMPRRKRLRHQYVRTNAQLSYGNLAAAAAKMPVPRTSR